MKKVEAVIRFFELDDVEDAVRSIGVQGMTVTEVKGFDRQNGHKEMCRGLEYQVDLRPRLKIEMVVPAEMVDQVIEKVITTARTGTIGEGTIFVTPVETAVRVRTGERDHDAVQGRETPGWEKLPAAELMKHFPGWSGGMTERSLNSRTSV